MNLSERLASIENKQEIPDAKRERQEPKGWEPGVVWHGDNGEITTGSLSNPPTDWDDVLTSRGLDPKKFEVVDNKMRWCSWDGWSKDPSGETVPAICYSFKAELRPRTNEPVNDRSLEELYKEVRKAKPPRKKHSEGDSTLVVALSDWQVGNALADETPVLTTGGWSKHGDIVPGEYVYGLDGTPVRVLAVTGSSEQMCYRVTFDHGESIIASGDHLWTGWRRCETTDGVYQRRRLTWTTSQIADLCHVEGDDRQHIEGAFHIELPAPLSLSRQELAIDPYVFGAWLGNGEGDGEWIVVAKNDLRHWVDSGFSVAVMPTKSAETTSSVRFVGLTSLLRNEGVLGQKWVPEKYLCGDTDQRLALLQGLMDTEGAVDVNGVCEFVNANSLLADVVEWLASSLGMKTVRTTKILTLDGEAKTEATVVRFTPNAALEHQQVFRMERKAARLSERADDETSFRFIRSVEPVGIRSAQCLTVEGSLYLVGANLVVTHNCDGGGVEAQMTAIANLSTSIPQRISDLRKMGYKIGQVAILGMGDLVEGTCGHYPAQQFRVQLDRRDQVKAVRRGVRDIIMAVAPLAEKVSVVAVPGNHGENRQNGKNITSVHDNDDVAVFEQVAEILSVNPEAYGHVGFRLSRDEIAVGIELSGKIVAITHGHVSKPGPNAGQALWNWWRDHAMGRSYPSVADADILISGHYHHLNVKEQENRAVFVCPSLTQVGDYFGDANGVQTRSGTLSLLISPDGWGELTLL